MSQPPHKSGFVSVIGLPNAGKSTLVNALSKEKLAIVTPKAQTTRHRIRVILSGEGYQVVLSDTPGLVKAQYKLHDAMMKVVGESLSDADLILFLTEPGKGGKEELIHEVLSKVNSPIIAVINKCDKLGKEKVAAYHKVLEEMKMFSEIIHISALKKQGTDDLLQKMIDLMPEGPPWFPEDQVSDRNVRFFVSEMIREQALRLYEQEIPYAVEVEIEGYEEKEHIDRIRAVIHVERTSQRAIILGHQGSAIKNLGTRARMDIEKFVGKKVYLELFVKVSKDWRNRGLKLREFGYE
ncbi:MAG: GTPase Era [Flavobacteriales bacterium]|nr:GTPase Era [Flavobacteriales bacterium]